jgi:uncharacterized protein (TIGR02001 family)
MLLNKKYTLVALATTLALSGVAVPTVANADLTGNIGVHSKYLLRGIFDENDNTAVQGGFDWSDDSGFYLGYWGSNLGYSYSDTSKQYTSNGFENDFYGGYGFKVADIGIDLGFTQYVYLHVDKSDLTEGNVKLTYMDGYIRTQTLLNSGWWGNSGDTYVTAGYSFSLPKDFGLALDYGYYFYNNNDNKDLGAPTLQDDGFRNFNITATHPLAATGADMYLQYVFAGQDRTGMQFSNSIVMGVTYGFDL